MGLLKLKYPDSGESGFPGGCTEAPDKDEVDSTVHSFSSKTWRHVLY